MQLPCNSWKEKQAAMKTEIDDRKQAMLMYHIENLTKAEICQRLNRTRPWLDRWLKRYIPGDVEHSLADQKAGPKATPSSWSSEIRQQVIGMRQERSQEKKWRYAFKGAEAIHLELKALGCKEVPPVRTIHAWLAKAGQIEHADKQTDERESKPVPLPISDAINRVQQLDLKGPVYLEGSRTKYYLSVLRDRYSHRCAIQVLNNKDAETIVDFLVAGWRTLGLPGYLQMDNALEFRGSNRYPRSFGKVVRVALDLGIEPVFNPPHEPWRNGGVEWFNSFITGRLLKVQFEDVDAFRAETKVCQDSCNQIHRLPALDGLTPNEIAAKAILRLLPESYLNHHSGSLPQDRGFVSFVRLVRKSGRITLGANDRFMVDLALAHAYVLARVDLARKLVTISNADQVIRTYDFSANTVGAWAEDDPI
jgi:putative transposase